MLFGLSGSFKMSLAPVVSWPQFPLSLSLAHPNICKPLEWREGVGALFHPPSHCSSGVCRVCDRVSHDRDMSNPVRH